MYFRKNIIPKYQCINRQHKKGVPCCRFLEVQRLWCCQRRFSVNTQKSGSNWMWLSWSRRTPQRNSYRTTYRSENITVWTDRTSICVLGFFLGGRGWFSDPNPHTSSYFCQTPSGRDLIFEQPLILFKHRNLFL